MFRRRPLLARAPRTNPTKQENPPPEELPDLTKELIISSLSNWPLSLSTFGSFLISQERMSLPPNSVLTGQWRIAEGTDIFVFQFNHDTSLFGAVNLTFTIDNKPESTFSYDILQSMIESPINCLPPLHVKTSFDFRVQNFAMVPVSASLTAFWYRISEDMWDELLALFQKYLGVQISSKMLRLQG